MKKSKKNINNKKSRIEFSIRLFFILILFLLFTILMGFALQRVYQNRQKSVISKEEQ